jgi:hypothetical protein
MRRATSRKEARAWLTGEEITLSTMQDKRLDSVRDRRLRADFHRRILQTLDALERRYGTVAKSSHGRSCVRWRIGD